VATLYKRRDRLAQAGLRPRSVSSCDFRAPGECQAGAGGVEPVTIVSGMLPQEPLVRGSLLVWWEFRGVLGWWCYGRSGGLPG